MFPNECCYSSNWGVQGEEEPGSDAEQHAACQDGLNPDAPLHSPPGVRHVYDSQVLLELIRSGPIPSLRPSK